MNLNETNSNTNTELAWL